MEVVKTDKDNSNGSGDPTEGGDGEVTLTADMVENLSRSITEDVLSLKWRLHRKHVFVFSEAGKPIFSRYGNEDKLVTLVGLLQALVSVTQDNNDDSLRSIRVKNTNIVFLIKSPLILVSVSRHNECVNQMQIRLTYYYNQIISILTSKQLCQIYEKRRNYDLRRLLAGSERLLHNLTDMVDSDPSFLLGAVKCLPMSNTARETISQTVIRFTSPIKSLIFAVLIANNQLVTLVRVKGCFMHPMDLHVLFNFIDASESFKTAESWTPLCLPRFDQSGFVHAHVSYLADDCQACLLLLTVDRDSFFTLSEARQKIVERLRRHGCMDTINASMSTPWPTISGLNISEIRHYWYKARAIAQYCAPSTDGIVQPYSSASSLSEQPDSESEVRHSAYFQLHNKLHAHSRPLKLAYVIGKAENWLGWITTSFELYVTFEPFVGKAAAINAVNRLIKWIKKDEERLFIMNSPTF